MPPEISHFVNFDGSNYRERQPLDLVKVGKEILSLGYTIDTLEHVVSMC
jgi:hypothetical protein